jgi:predicted nucleic acid-binding protein
MKSFFIDTNVLIDFLSDRPPFTKFAIVLFQLAESNEIKLYTSSHSIATAHYLLKKFIPEAQIRAMLDSLLDLITIIPVDLYIIRKSLLSKYKDFEDAIQIYAANSINNIDYMVTRNLKDFKGADIPAIAPDQLLNYL